MANVLLVFPTSEVIPDVVCVFQSVLRVRTVSLVCGQAVFSDHILYEAEVPFLLVSLWLAVYWGRL